MSAAAFSDAVIVCSPGRAYRRGATQVGEGTQFYGDARERSIASQRDGDKTLIRTTSQTVELDVESVTVTTC